ncbi:CBS domain-containing protein [Nitrospirillum sp. BR 11164]|uniref:CBS domain-containing protein n=1 Tax=Nitrospirillum sp. BR 11164 TaxID=3104324 RepID=UPI002B001593|nr:CBS domain-containing protein [Nitrospirillum sp. BR 11164]MEA1652207.1 CBS domain-containing protein [Nitrospirillum sp. BR 11164]
MRIQEIMSTNVKLATPDQKLRDAARLMSECDIGAIPVGQGDRLVGMVTDRDITIRGVAEGRGPDATVGEVMTPQVCYCYEDEDVEQVCHNMVNVQMRRLPVLNREKRLVGIVALGDLAVRASATAGRALSGISQRD